MMKSDLISREAAIMAVMSITMSIQGGKVPIDTVLYEIKALPSAEAEPTVVRCKTMIPYGDFREWAKRIREDNPNVIVIPCDAEVASAEADRPKGEWTNVNTTNPPRFYHMGECSICGAHGQITDNFCPNCGAKMKGGDTE